SLEENQHARVKVIAERSEYLLMEAARLIDERKKAPSSSTQESLDYELVQISESEVTRHPLSQQQTLIGRSSSCQIQLSNTTISSTHAEITLKNNQFYLTDLNSSNGSFINSKRVSRTDEIHLGDQVQIGACLFELRKKGDQVQAPVPQAKTHTMQDTRKFVFPDLDSASKHPTVNEQFRAVQPVESTVSSNPNSAVIYVLIGIGAGALVALIIFLSL
ncbi:MAG: FHA domain-containing protein, partial [Verrucomicrobiota bacterium]